MTIVQLKRFLFTAMLLLSLIDANGQVFNNVSFQIADSLYFAGDWTNAVNMYKQLIKDSSINSVEWQRLGFSYYNLGKPDEALISFQRAEKNNPSAAMLPLLFSRIAKTYSIKNDHEKTLEYLDKAITAGYSNLKELDSSREFAAFQNVAKFKDLRDKVYNTLHPCLANSHAREFDFWAGEWDVYVTGTKNYAGHSLVQIISGGCALLENWDSPNSTGKSINFIDPNTNKWKQSWAGSYANGIQEFVNGEYKDSAMRFEFETKDAQGKRIIGRFIFYNQGPNQVRQFNETSNDNGKTWATTYDFTYFRKK